MKSLLRISVLGLFGLAVALLNCKNTGTGPDNSLGNLLANGSFELNGHPTFGSWALVDTPLDTMTLFKQDVPPFGGSFCLEVTPRPPDANWARAYATGILALGGVFRVTVWARTTNDWPNGSIAFGKISQGFPTILKSKGTPSPDWTQYTLEDTLDVSTQDSLFVQLSPGQADQIVPGTMRFDLIKLEQLR